MATEENPDPVKVIGPVELKKDDAVNLPPSTAQTTTKTERTEVVTGPPGQAPPPAVIADDNIRKWIAQEAIITDFLLAMFILYLLFFQSSAVSKDVLPFATGAIGTIIGYKARDVGTVYGYLFGSSSGSTAKSAILEKK